MPHRRLPLLGALALAASLFPSVATVVAADAASAAPAAARTPSGFAIHRGTNVSHWLSQDFGWAPRAGWFTENDVRWLARAGFDHVRLPVDEKELWDDHGAPIEPAFALLEQALGWCRTHGLRAIVDLHTLRSHHFNAANEGGTNTLFTDPKAQEQFLGLWKQLSARLRHHPVDRVAYELMNEPVADEHAQWNALVAAGLRTLRALEPDRVIVLGGNRWQLPGSLPHLAVPAGDKNIILSLHTYEPFAVTHYRSGWTPLKNYHGPVAYPGFPVPPAHLAELETAAGKDGDFIVNNAKQAWDAARLERELAPAFARAKELGLPLYCGEFGCLPTAPRAARLAYYRDLVGVLEKHGAAWANWEYKGDFGVFEWHGLKGLNGAPDTELLDVLFQRR